MKLLWCSALEAQTYSWDTDFLNLNNHQYTLVILSTSKMKPFWLDSIPALQCAVTET